MNKITKPEVKCKTCGHTITWAESEEFCDECGKKLTYSKVNGYPMEIRFILHDVNGTMTNDDRNFNFCSVRDGFKWLIKNGKKRLKHPEDFLTLDYWHKWNIDKLFKLLKVIR